MRPRQNGRRFEDHVLNLFSCIKDAGFVLCFTITYQIFCDSFYLCLPVYLFRQGSKVKQFHPLVITWMNILEIRKYSTDITVCVKSTFPGVLSRVIYQPMMRKWCTLPLIKADRTLACVGRQTTKTVPGVVTRSAKLLVVLTMEVTHQSDGVVDLEPGP